MVAFCPKILGRGEDLRIVILTNWNASSVVLTMLGGRDTRILLDGKKIELYTLAKFELYSLTGSGDAKTF